MSGLAADGVAIISHVVKMPPKGHGPLSVCDAG